MMMMMIVRMICRKNDDDYDFPKNLNGFFDGELAKVVNH
jgi:hypothetical protein